MRVGRLIWGLYALGLILGSGIRAGAQEPGSGFGGAFRFSPAPALPSSGSSYLPYGSSGGGFIPYTAGPGGGLGVQTRRQDPSISGMTTPGVMGTSMGGPSRSILGMTRDAIAPLAPIRSRGASMGAAMPGITPAGGMRSMSRPPVGGYPFRQPPILIGPATSAPAMSM